MARALIVATAAVLLAGCSTAHPGASQSTVTTGRATSAPATGTTTTVPATPPTPTGPATTVAIGGVPADMLNPAVTPATIMTTICVGGYTTTIRPPTSFTEPLKAHQIATYGYADRRLGDYEEDHVIALEIGGAPAVAVNLFPESHTVSFTDDTLENSLHIQVCDGQMTLAAARLRLFTVKVAHGYSRAASGA